MGSRNLQEARHPPLSLVKGLLIGDRDLLRLVKASLLALQVGVHLRAPAAEEGVTQGPPKRVPSLTAGIFKSRESVVG